MEYPVRDHMRTRFYDSRKLGPVFHWLPVIYSIFHEYLIGFFFSCDLHSYTDPCVQQYVVSVAVLHV